MANNPYFFLDTDYIAPGMQRELYPRIYIKRGTLGVLRLWHYVCINILFLPWFLLLILFLGMVVIDSVQDMYQYHTQGVQTDGLVFVCDEETDNIFYMFMVDNTVYSGDDLIRDIDDCRMYPTGTHIFVQYLANNRSESRFIKTSVADEFQHELFVIFGSVYGMIALVWATCIIFHLFIRSEIGRRRRARLMDQPFLLDGEIIYCRGWSRTRNSPNYKVTVKYRFRTPYGKILIRKQSSTSIQYDIRKGILPPKGTPVKVLYADDHAVIML